MTTTTIENIRMDDIAASPLNPRKTFSEEAITELAVSIQTQGLLQPITVRPVGWTDLTDEHGEIISVPTHYEIVCGERRYRACRMAGYDEIAAIVREMTDDEALDAMITENLQRKDVDPMEEAEAFSILSQRGSSAEELAARFGKSERFVRDRIRLTTLAAPLRPLVSDGRLPITAALMLARLDDGGAAFAGEYASEIDNGDSFSTSDIKEHLNKIFSSLYRAPFHDGMSLAEPWNDGTVILRCDSCPACSASTGCLFPEFADEDPTCSDVKCYERKKRIYFSVHLLGKYASDLVMEDGEIEEGSTVVLDDLYDFRSDRAKENYRQLAGDVRERGIRLVKKSDLGRCLFYKGSPSAVRALSLDDYVSGFAFSEDFFFEVKDDAEMQGKPVKQNWELATELGDIESRAGDRLARKLHSMLVDSGYCKRTERIGTSYIWERLLVAAIVADRLSFDDFSKLFPDGWNYDMLISAEKTNAWMRAAFIKFLETSNKLSILKGIVPLVCDDAFDVIRKAEADVEKKQRPIIEELERRGCDRKGRRLGDG